MSRQIGYDTDFYAWAREQGRLLREASREPVPIPIDWENVAEEIESIGRRERRDLREGISVPSYLSSEDEFYAYCASLSRTGFIIP